MLQILLCSSGNIILLHLKTIHSLCSKFSFNPFQVEGFLSYAREKFSQITEKERIVILMLDKIHLKSMLDYKRWKYLWDGA